MGVIHKLTEEVIDFILEKKKEDPKIGCRSLSEIVSERFSRKISKSSINAVLKEHGLSGTIGRPAVSGAQKKAAFSIPQEKKAQLFGIEHAKATEEVPPAPAIKPVKIIETKEDRPSLRVDPIELEPAQGANQDAAVRKKQMPAQVQSGDTFLDEVEIIREKERQEAGADLLSVGAVFVHAAAHHLGLVSMMSNLLRQHVSAELPASLGQICSSVLALRFLGIGKDDEVLSSKTEIVWAMNGRDLKGPTREFWAKFAGAQLPKRFDLIFKNEIVQQMAHGAFFRIATENGPAIVMDAQLSRLGGKALGALPLCSALDVLSERIIANNQPAIIESVDDSDEGNEQLKIFTTAFCHPDARFKKADVLNGAGETMASFSQIPRKKRNFIVGINATNKLFNTAAPSLKWGAFAPLYIPRLDMICRMAQFDPTPLADELGLPCDLAKVTVISSQNEKGSHKALISNLKGISGAVIAEQFLNRWPVSEQEMSSMDALPIDEINNTLESTRIDSVFSCFDLLNKLILAYLSKTVFKDIDNISDVTSLERMLYAINGKILLKNDHVKARINAYQPEKLNDLLRSASFGLSRWHVLDQDKRSIVILASGQ